MADMIVERGEENGLAPWAWEAEGVGSFWKAA